VDAARLSASVPIALSRPWLRRTLIAVVLVAAVAAAIWWLGRPKPIPVVVTEAARGRVEATIANTRAGTVEACLRTKLSPIMGGRIELLKVKEGEIQITANSGCLGGPESGSGSCGNTAAQDTLSGVYSSGTWSGNQGRCSAAQGGLNGATTTNSRCNVWTSAQGAYPSGEPASIPLLTDSDFRAKAYEKVKPLVENPQSDALVRRATIRALVSMNNDPAAIFASLTALVERGEEVPAAAQGLRVIPRPKWPRAQATPAVNGLVAWAKTVPVANRTTQDYSQIVQLAGDLAGLMPAEQAASARKELRELQVSLFVIRTVREQMRYDTPRLVVEAGKPFEIIFENLDFMSHNLLIVKPNTREKIGLAAAAMKPEDVDSEGRIYVPASPDVLAATKMLQTGEKETLQLTAPSAEGECEYVCTFPGHYQVMRGQLVVTKNVEAYLQGHPEPVLPAPVASSEDGTTPAHAHGH